VEQDQVKPFLSSVFGVLSSITETDEPYWEQDFSDSTSLIGKALVTLQKMMELLPSEKEVLTFTVELIEVGICSWSPGPRKAACLAIAVIANDHETSPKCLERLLAHLATAIKDYHPVVRSAALFALERFYSSPKVS